MSEILRHMFLGMGALILAPTNKLPRPKFTITLPPENAIQAIGYDFSHVASDFNRSIQKIESADQLELNLKTNR